jgi:putative phosphoesterase
MLVAVIADTHLPRGTRAIPGQARELMRSSDLILHAGDFVSEQVLEEIEALGPRVHAVHGNMDSAALRASLPRETVVDANGVRIGIIHDSGPTHGRLQRLRLRFPDADAVVFDTRMSRFTNAKAASRSSIRAARPSAGARLATRSGWRGSLAAPSSSSWFRSIKY